MQDLEIKCESCEWGYSGLKEDRSFKCPKCGSKNWEYVGGFLGTAESGHLGETACNDCDWFDPGIA